MGFYPGAADLNAGVISVEQALNNPTTIEERVAEVAAKNLLIDTIFSTDAQPVEGGAVIYSEITEKNFYTKNDVTQRQPGDEYAVVYREKPEAKLARIEDYGAKFAVSDEARRRNQAVDFDNDVQALANTITRKLNQRAMETIKAAEDHAVQVVATLPWNEVVLADPVAVTPPAQRPMTNLADAIAAAEVKDLGINYQKAIVNPLTKATLRMIYGADLTPALADLGLELLTSNYVDTTAAYLVDPGKAGFVRYEEPLTITTWRDEHHRQTWVQGYAMPVIGVTMPAAIAKISGITE